MSREFVSPGRLHPCIHQVQRKQQGKLANELIGYDWACLGQMKHLRTGELRWLSRWVTASPARACASRTVMKTDIRTC